jgi:hypothetical protein
MDRRSRDIVKADRAVRQAREAEELIALAREFYPSEVFEGCDPYHVSRSITGEPSEKNRVHRATDNCWNRGMRGRTVGIAPGTEDSSDGTATVRVIHANGNTEIRSARSFRPERIAKRQARHIESRRTIAECARLDPIGNVE